MAYFRPLSLLIDFTDDVRAPCFHIAEHVSKKRIAHFFLRHGFLLISRTLLVGVKLTHKTCHNTEKHPYIGSILPQVCFGYLTQCFKHELYLRRIKLTSWECGSPPVCSLQVTSEISYTSFFFLRVRSFGIVITILYYSEHNASSP